MGITQITKRNGETIQLNTNEPFCFVKEATLTSSLMGDDYISLKIVSANWLSFAKGDKITVGGKEYSIRATTTREVVSEGYYNYEPVFYGVMYDLMKTIYRNCDKYGKSDKSTFDLTYTIKEFVQVLIYNMERDYPGLWKFDVDNCPDTEAKTIQFSGVNCLQALQTLCNSEQFNLDFQITQDKGVRTIHIGKFGKRINPPSGADFFEWGKGNGLYNLKEQKIDDKAIITRLWAEGGTTNIRSNYRDYSERLQLPYPQRKNQYEHTLSDGTVVKVGTETIGIADDAKRYIEDAALRDKIGSEEDVKTYDNIYPTRTGTVTAVVADDICAFIDDTMDFDLNKKDDKGTVYLVDGTSAKITFTSGRLAGQQFELEAKGGYNHETKKFRIIPFTDNRGLTIPSAETQDAYRIEVGNTYKITDIYLPESYEQKAEENLWYAAMEDFKTATQAKAQYTLTLDRLYFLQELSRDTDTSVFEVGDYVPVKDTRFGIEKQMRIQKVTRNLLLEQDYQITLADTTAVSIQTQTVLTVIEHENIINNNRLRDLNKARRGWRTTEDLRNMVYDTDGYFDTENIKPNSIDTNMLTVGAKSQQFVLSGCVLKANFGGNPNMFVATAGILSHLTIDNDKIRSWQMNEASFELQSTGGYYLFAKCSKSGENGVWYLTQEQLKFEPTSDPNNYYFQVGIISSLYSDDNFRDFQTTYGFTRINGNTITTGRIITSDGECYLDLDGNKFRIGDSTSSIDWNVSAKSRLTLKNVSVASGSGDVVPLGVYRGVWNKDYIYYYGDEVSYTDNSGATCTYRYNHATPSKGIVPTNTVYWGVVAQGANGKNGVNGSTFYFIYTAESSTPSTPTFTDPTSLIEQSVWSLKPPTPTSGKFVYMSQAMLNARTNTFGTWSTPIRITGLNGENGADGTDIEFIYLRNTGDTPSKPASVNKDDYVPSGWTDSPSGITATYQYEWVCVRTKPSGSGTWSAYSTPVIWAKWGDKGTDGDGTEYVFKRTEVETAPDAILVSSTADGYVPSGWTDEPSGVSADYPFEWVSIRHKTNGKWGAFSEPTLWNNYVVWNPNLLEQTEFESMDRLDKWDVVSRNNGGSGIDTSIAHINTSGVDGHNCFYDANNKRENESVYKEVLRQVLQSSTVKKLKASTWYTLSFWAKCGTNTLTVKETSSAYGFAQRTLYLRSGHKYTFSFNGRIDAQAKSDRKELRCFIWQDGWKWQKEISVSNTYNTTASISFDDVPADGVYHFAAYLYDSTDPRTGKATLNWVRILETGGAIFSTYVFPSAIDTSKVFVDGVQNNNTIGADCVVNYPTYTSWKKHTITFKTKSSFADIEYVLFRLQPIIIEGNSQYLYICMPKLELGKVATAYDANSNDNRPDYQEYRFAKNGSRNSAPALVKTDAEPSGWTTTQPTVGTLEYLWMIVAKKSATGALLTNWSEPVRITPYDGKDGENGKSPAMVYRGVYDSSKTYYGNQYRVDAVKYNGTYYIARIDAGEFYNVAPTNTSKWNNFGAQFESIATNLLLAEGANIGDWFISKGKIVSTLEQGNKITLDAKGGEILLETSNNGGDNVMSEYQGVYGANIKASLNNGTVEVRSKKNSSSVSYISPTGVFSNMAGTDGMPLSSGYTHRGAVVGLGFANVKKREWAVNAVETIVAGVYGRADNSGTAPAYGGFFYDLYAGGLTLGRICITENGKSGHSSYLSSDDSLVIGYSRYAETVYLPSDPKEGQVIFVKQWWSGSLLFKPLTGHHIYDDSSENTDYAFSEGQGGMFVFTIGYVNSVKKESWIVSRWKF
jgi:hypothetical protein|nr:MAG TPA: Protein gp18.1, prophage tail protein gp18.7A [Caudoviricetes sp.]